MLKRYLRLFSLSAFVLQTIDKFSKRIQFHVLGIAAFGFFSCRKRPVYCHFLHIISRDDVC